MATAYRHMGLGSPSQVMYFVDERRGEIQENVRRWKDEDEMWAKLDQRPGDAVPAAARGHLRSRRRALADAISSATRELTILEEMRASFNPCPACNGTGGFSVSYAHDDVRIEPCEACKGTKVVTP